MRRRGGWRDEVEEQSFGMTRQGGDLYLSTTKGERRTSQEYDTVTGCEWRHRQRGEKEKSS